MNTLQLKPCPFCGDEFPTLEGQEGIGFTIHCLSCDADGGEAYTVKAAANKWNTRATTADEEKKS